MTALGKTPDLRCAKNVQQRSRSCPAQAPIPRRLATLAEIAAGSFAQALLELPCHPKVLDFVAGDRSSPGTGGKLVAAGRIGARTRAGEGGTFARK
jgi:hypothetical protein